MHILPSSLGMFVACGRGLIDQVVTPGPVGPGIFILYLHGGAFCVCNSATHRGILTRIVHKTNATIFSLNYRRPPESPFPIPVDDCVDTYIYLLQHIKTSDRIFLAGDSAGGNLVVATLLRIHNESLRPPTGAVLLSPWVDLTDIGVTDSWRKYQDVDYLPEDLARLFAECYRGRTIDCPAAGTALPPPPPPPVSPTTTTTTATTTTTTTANDSIITTAAVATNSIAANTVMVSESATDVPASSLPTSAPSAVNEDSLGLRGEETATSNKEHCLDVDGLPVPPSAPVGVPSPHEGGRAEGIGDVVRGVSWHCMSPLHFGTTGPLYLHTSAYEHQSIPVLQWVLYVNIA